MSTSGPARVDRTRVTEIASELVSIASVNPDMGGADGGERLLAAYIARFFRDAGLEVELQEVLPGRPNVIGRLLRDRDFPWIVFEGHLDTVPAPDGLVPRIADGRLHGRGACDTKGGIAAALHTMECLRDLDGLALNVEFAGTIDEEFAFRGVRGYLRDNPRRAAGVVLEPTSLAPVVAHNGVVRGRIVARGRAAHSAAPELGSNAITALIDAAPALTRWALERFPNGHPLTGPTTFSITKINGGTSINTIPAECSAEFDWRLGPSDDPHDALSALGAHLATTGAPLQLTPLLEDRGFVLASDHPFVGAVQEACVTITGRGELRGLRAGTDASKLVHAGIPAVVLGPGALEQAHTADEWVGLDELAQAAEVFVELCVNAARYLARGPAADAPHGPSARRGGGPDARG